MRSSANHLFLKALVSAFSISCHHERDTRAPKKRDGEKVPAWSGSITGSAAVRRGPFAARRPVDATEKELGRSRWRRAFSGAHCRLRGRASRKKSAEQSRGFNKNVRLRAPCDSDLQPGRSAH